MASCGHRSKRTGAPVRGTLSRLEDLTFRDHLERMMPAGGRGRQVLGWGVMAWSAIGAVILLGVLFRVIARMAPIFPYLVVASMVVFVLNPAVTRLTARGIDRKSVV